MTEPFYKPEDFTYPVGLNYDEAHKVIAEQANSKHEKECPYKLALEIIIKRVTDKPAEVIARKVLEGK